jgi:phage shock protein A
MAKIKEKQLEQVNALREAQTKLRLELGDLHLAMRNIKARQEALEAEADEAEEKAGQLLNEIREEYGNGSVDVETGEFTPSPEEV